MSLYCDIPLPAFIQDICENEEGRIIAIALLRSDHAIVDPENSGQWNTAIGNGTAVIIKNVRGEKPKASEVTIDGFGRQKNRTVGYERTATYQHPDVIGNENFYDILNFDSSHQFAYYTQGKKVWMPPTGEAPIANFDADTTIETGLDSIIIFDVAVSWSAQNMHRAYTAPAGIFE